MRQITFAPVFREWQRLARGALSSGLAPDEVVWEELHGDQPSLGMFEEAEPGIASPASAFRVPRDFVEMAQRVACHRAAERWSLLYRLLWRLTHGESHLMKIAVDPVVHALQRMDKAIRHDVHKMRAFVRFRAVAHQDQTWYVAWFEPEHHIVEFNAPFFRDRFASMHWSILTPHRCVHWDGAHLTFTVGVPKSEAPTEDAVETLWLGYYGSIFNPARVKTRAMEAEMPKRYWKNLPEAALIPSLLREAPHRVEQMIHHSQQKSAEDYSPAPVPETHSLTTLREAASICTACPLYKNATQTVFGEGPRNAEIVFVGEQPGDQEDLAGHPFIGPAGQLLNRALEEVGIDRKLAYVTNAVKHFKWEPRGKRRLHAKPNSREIIACKPWLMAELAAIHPRVLVLLGGTAAQSVLGSKVRVLRDRGQLMHSEYCQQTMVTVHPSSLLRAPDEESRQQGYADFVKDLRIAADLLSKGNPH
ncbi:MAG: phage polymerase-related protein [Verrucomicrobiaceae bacterium]|nr:phage polymerase-related protein [Verrucomicrobiaceae bacterium]